MECRPLLNGWGSTSVKKALWVPTSMCFKLVVLQSMRFESCKSSLHRQLRSVGSVQLSASTSRMHSIRCMDTHYECARKCKGAGIPLQHHQELLLRLGDTCTNSIRHDKKRDDMVSHKGQSLDPCFGISTLTISWRRTSHQGYHLLHQWYPSCYDRRFFFMLEWKVKTALEAVTHWIKSEGLSLVTMKTKSVLFTDLCQFNPLSFCLKRGR